MNSPRRHLAVPVDVREHDLVVLRRAGAPVQDLLAGQVFEDQLLIDDVGSPVPVRRVRRRRD
ncbi:hypothetical protein ACWC09_36000 [Streptomyces sp. NPDC001617]